MPVLTRSERGSSIQCMPLPSAFTRLSAAGTISVDGYTIIQFDADCDALQLNTGSSVDAANYWTMSPGEAWTIPNEVTDVYVNGSCGYALK